MNTAAGHHAIAMVTSSYPRFPGDPIGTFMEPIATGVAARGYDVHLVAPWHPAWRRPPSDAGVQFHLYRYAPARALNVFGYAGALRADTALRLSAIAVAPAALVAGTFRASRVARATRAALVHAHWVIPGGVMGAAAAGSRPLVISLHGSDIFVAERHWAARLAARWAFERASWVTACSDDLRRRAIALGAAAERSTVVPYGVDADRFAPDAGARLTRRQTLGVAPDAPIVFAMGRLARKKGFEYLIAAMPALIAAHPSLRLVIAGDGDLDAELRALADRKGVAGHTHFLGSILHQDVPGWLAAADVAVVPSVHDEAGNVDGLPNTALEIMASGTPLVATRVGGITAIADDGRTARLVPERDPAALAGAIGNLLASADRRRTIGGAARAVVRAEFSWAEVARRFDEIYRRVLSGVRGSQP